MGLKHFIEKLNLRFYRVVNMRNGMHYLKQPPPSYIPQGQSRTKLLTYVMR